MNFNDFKKYINKKITGIVQVGAHYGQELNDLMQLTDNIILFEPQKDVYEVLQNNIKNLTTVKAENLALGNIENSKVEMFKTRHNDSQSSSLLEPHLHLEQYPGCQFPEREIVDITSANLYFKQKEFNYNFLILDTQGYELNVLQGFTDYLNKIDFILTEVSNVELYKNCVLIGDLDSFLQKFNFKRIETDWEGQTWGNALYVKY